MTSRISKEPTCGLHSPVNTHICRHTVSLCCVAKHSQFRSQASRAAPRKDPNCKDIKEEAAQQQNLRFRLLPTRAAMTVGYSNHVRSQGHLCQTTLPRDALRPTLPLHARQLTNSEATGTNCGSMGTTSNLVSGIKLESNLVCGGVTSSLPVARTV